MGEIGEKMQLWKTMWKMWKSNLPCVFIGFFGKPLVSGTNRGVRTLPHLLLVFKKYQKISNNLLTTTTPYAILSL